MNEADRTFAPFTLTHALTVLVCAVVIVGVCVLGRRAVAHERDGSFRLWLGLLGLASQAVSIWFFARPSVFGWGTSLPLHVCDLVGVVAPLALLTGIRPLRTVLYFFGLGLSSQGFATPIVQHGPAHAEFWIFWVNHTVAVGYAIVDLAVFGYRPRFRDLLLASGIGVLYTLLMVAVNLSLADHRANYAFVGDVQLVTPTVIDRLGEWPIRVVWMTMIAISAFTLMWAAWPLADCVLRRPRTDR